MNNALGFPFGFFVNDNTPADAKYFKNFNTFGTKIPYVSVLEANTLLVSGIRHIGLTVNIAGVEYWYNNGILDTDLVIKQPPVSSNQASIKEFSITGDNINNIFNFTHNFNNRNIEICVIENFGFYEKVEPRRYSSSLNGCSIEFQVIPAIAEDYNVMVIAIDKNSTPTPTTGIGYMVIGSTFIIS